MSADVSIKNQNLLSITGCKNFAKNIISILDYAGKKKKNYNFWQGIIIIRNFSFYT